MLAEASRDRRTVRVVGGMTKSYIGDVGDTDTEVRTSGLAGIVDHVPADLTVTVVGGTRMADLADALARAGQFLPLDPPHADHGTIGGIIAANSNGFWRARYGGVRDLLIGTRIALPDGTVARSGGRVVKNVAGYDLNKLITGSFGTLGVIVEATLKVLPVPTASDGVVAMFARGPDAFAAASAIARAASRPEGVAVERTARDDWRLIATARRAAAAVARAIAGAGRPIKARGGRAATARGRRDGARRRPTRPAPPCTSAGVADPHQRRVADAPHQGCVRSGRHPRARTIAGMTATFPLPYPNADAPGEDLIARCVHCGFCLPTCPTFAVLGVE